MIFKDNRIFDALKWSATVGLPALASLTLVVGQIWGLTEWTVPIGATIAAVATFIGALVGVSSIKYAKINAGGDDDVKA